MWQKYRITKNDASEKLHIREFAVLENVPRMSEIADINQEDYSLLCEESYDSQDVTSAIVEGKTALIGVLRTRNMYPISVYAEAIAESVIELYDSKAPDSVELLFDDTDLLQ
ncbi:MAG: hypothetical protein WAL90_13110 [Desulfobacterales bacterium]